MGFGKYVLITRPPSGFEKWVDKKAEVITLLPIAKHPLLYELKVCDDKKTLTLPADALDPFKIKREESKEHEYVIVNDLMYCLEHELSVCGKCGVDHRHTHFIKECTHEDSLDLVEDWYSDMQRLGAPPRRAPQMRGKEDFPGNPALFRPAVSEHLVILGKDTNTKLNPSASSVWPKDSKTERVIRQYTNFTNEEYGINEVEKLPVRRVRETIVALANRWDGLSNSEPLPRIMLQDEAQTQVLTLDLVPPIRILRVGAAVLPLFIVRWAHVKATDGFSKIQAVLSTMKQGTKMGEIPVEVDEIEFLVELLKKNAERLNPCFVEQTAITHLFVSAITPISSEMQTLHYDSVHPYCFQCGTSGCDIRKCSRCRKVAYCSRACQKMNWKFHKAKCSS